MTMPAHVIIQNRGRPGLLAGLLGCAFGVLGVVSFGLVFVPLAALCSFVGLLRGMFGGSASGIGASLLAAILCVVGFATSPSLWAVTAAGILASNPSAALPPAPTSQAATVRLNSLTQKLNASAVEANAQLAKFPPIEQRYRAITEMMHAGLARQQSIYGPGQAMVARSQIAVAINQAGVEAEQLHISVQSAQHDIALKLEPLVKNAVNMRQHCQSIVTDGSTNLPSESGNPHSVCLKFLETAKRFDQNVGALVQAFEKAEQVWIEERRKQAGIIQAATIASQ